MLDTHELVTSYRGHEIYLRKPGFEFAPVTLLKISSFLVRPPSGQLTVFAFAYSLLEVADSGPVNEDALLDSAVHAMDQAINAGEIRELTDRTFRYRGDQWEEVQDPNWWISAFE